MRGPGMHRHVFQQLTGAVVIVLGVFAGDEIGNARPYLKLDVMLSRPIMVWWRVRSRSVVW